MWLPILWLGTGQRGRLLQRTDSLRIHLFIQISLTEMAVRLEQWQGNRIMDCCADSVRFQVLEQRVAAAARHPDDIEMIDVLHAFSGWNPSLGPLGAFIVTASVIVQGIFLSLFVGMLSGVVPAFGAARKPVVATLHEVF